MESQPFLPTEETERRFGAEIRRARQVAQLTQVELAEAANVSLSSVKSLESGRGSTLSTVIRVARALGRGDWLTDFAPPAPSVSPLELLRQREARSREEPKRVRHRRVR